MSELLNLVGLSTGVVLYAMLLAMVVRAGRAPARRAVRSAAARDRRARSRSGTCARCRRTSCRRSASGPFPLLIAAGFSALGFLPAVVVHSVLRDERDGRARRPEAVDRGRRRTRSAPSRRCCTSRAAWTGGAGAVAVGMRLLTYTFVALVLPLAAVTRGQPGRAARAVGGGAGDLRGVGAAPQPAAPGRRVVAVELSATTRRCRWRSPSCTRTIRSRSPICS